MRHATCGPNHAEKDHADFARRVQLMFLSPQAQYNAWDSADGTTLWPSGPTPTLSFKFVLTSANSHPNPGGPGAANCSAEWLSMFKSHYDLRTGLASYIYSAFEAQVRTSPLL